ncbi:MAG: glycosyltransferase, partial [Candidatus Thermofonsia Clade 1 bacterium]
DQSWTVIQALAERHAWITGIDLMRNYGQHNALLCGIRAAKHAVIVTMDDDLQHPPAEIPKLLAELAKGYDVVYGTPIQEQHGLWRDLASQVTKLALQSAMGIQTARKVSAFRAFRSEIRRAFAHYNSPYVSIDVLLTWGTTRFSAIAVEHAPRRFGKSNYTLRKLIIHTFNMMTGFSALPLQLASLLGFAFTGLGGLIFLYVIGRYLIEGGSVPGFPFLASMIAIFSGVQLFTLGIIGEYLARMHFRSMERPASVVRQVIRHKEHIQEFQK